jgi:hypothetical protein
MERDMCRKREAQGKESAHHATITNEANDAMAQTLTMEPMWLERLEDRLSISERV